MGGTAQPRPAPVNRDVLTAPASPTVHVTPSQLPASGSFNVSGNMIVGPGGQQFVPYGVVVECLAEHTTDITKLCAGPASGVSAGALVRANTGAAIVTAAAQGWNANIIRFQVSQENLFSGPNGSVNPAYVDLVDSFVTQTNRLGMVATITLQEEDQHGYAYPTESSVLFWQYMASHYKSSPGVFFDLYNEPQLPTTVAGSEDNVWNIWQHGGNALSVQTGVHQVLGTTDIAYVGMQTLVNTVRAQGANNIVIAEGPHYDQDLTELTSHYLTGSNIAYGTEPNLASNKILPGNDRTMAEQYVRFGQYIKAVPIIPEAFLDNYGTRSCDPNSPTDVPALLQYLKSLDMGLIFYSLEPGLAIVGSNLSEPTSYGTATSIASSLCPTQGGNQQLVTNTIGPGAQFLAYFTANSQKALPIGP